MSSEEPQAPGFCKGSCVNFPWLKTLRFFGVILGILVIILGCYSIITSSIDITNIVNSAYRILFGFLIILAELRLEKWLKFFTFLNSYFGLGIFYIFVGGLALGGAWYEYVLAIAFLAMGCIYVSMGCCYSQKMYVHPPTAAPVVAASGVQAPTKTVVVASSKKMTQQQAPQPQAEMVQFEEEHNDDSAWPEDRV